MNNSINPMNFKFEEDWLRQKAKEEDGCIVSVVGLVSDIERMERWAGSGNYVANHEVFPTEVKFANGRKVSIRWQQTESGRSEAFLEIK